MSPCQVVICHDSDLERTTGVEGIVEETNFAVRASSGSIYHETDSHAQIHATETDQQATSSFRLSLNSLLLYSIGEQYCFVH